MNLRTQLDKELKAKQEELSQLQEQKAKLSQQRLGTRAVLGAKRFGERPSKLAATRPVDTWLWLLGR